MVEAGLALSATRECPGELEAARRWSGRVYSPQQVAGRRWTADGGRRWNPTPLVDLGDREKASDGPPHSFAAPPVFAPSAMPVAHNLDLVQPSCQQASTMQLSSPAGLGP